jgi:CheY-like chemotaxis protein
MNRPIATKDQCSFSARELSKQILECVQTGKVGYWEHQFDAHTGELRENAADVEPPNWNLAIANGRILYAGNRLWSSQSLMRTIYRYVAHTRNNTIKPQFDRLKQQADEGVLSPLQLLAAMKKIGLINDVQLSKALEMKILNDLDIYLLMGSGKAKFIVDRDLATQLPVEGFLPASLIEEAKKRQILWDKIQPQVPSMNLIPAIDRSALEKANLPDGQKQRIENLVKSHLSLNSIAQEMAKDTLEIAQMFAKLNQSGLIGFQPPQKNTPAPIMIIDDSPPILAQFQHWVGGMGYPVVICQQSETALATIVEVEPAAIFIDINMPGLSGFELVRQIRKQPQLAAIPLVILTGEQKLSNRWRAQWSGCDFLTKPLTSSDVNDFQARIEELLLRLVGTPQSLTNQNYSQN